MHDTTQTQQRFEHLAPYLNERLRRLLAAAEAKAIGHGGALAVERSTGVSRRAIRAGIRELAQRQQVDTQVVKPVRIRRPGGGRKKAIEKNPRL